MRGGKCQSDFGIFRGGSGGGSRFGSLPVALQSKGLGGGGPWECVGFNGLFLL
jgi:hypothetical protein